jgi:RimJ/RimL family protein N-acetyltransferase
MQEMDEQGPVEVLRTQRLILREMTDDDLDDIARLLGDPEVMRYYPRPKTRAEAKGWIGWNRSLYQQHGFGLWIMTLADTGEFVGECGLTIQVVDATEEVEVGYHLLPAFQRRGYATEAASACRRAALDTFGADRVIAVINPDNRPSQLVAERIGLRVEKHAQLYGADRVIYASRPAARPDPNPAGQTDPGC